MKIFGNELYARLQRLAVARYGHTFDGFYRIIHDILLYVWSTETARPAWVSSWSTQYPRRGQDDVTSYFLAKYVFGGNVVVTTLRNGQTHFLIWQVNGESTITQDFCSNQSDVPVQCFLQSLEPDHFITLAKEGLLDMDFDIERRVRAFAAVFHDTVDVMEARTSSVPSEF